MSIMMAKSISRSRSSKILGLVKVCPLAEGGKTALTRYHVLGYYGGYTLLELELVTGRTHQIRVHMAYMGHPVVGDGKYGDFQDCRKVRALTGLDSSSQLRSRGACLAPSCGLRCTLCRMGQFLRGFFRGQSFIEENDRR
jgi:hypothetical protein